MKGMIFVKRMVCFAGIALLLTACGNGEEKINEQTNDPLEQVEEAKTAMNENLLGKWQGMIEIPQAPLEIVLNLEGNSGSLSVPVQGLVDYPMESLQFDKDKMEIRFNLAGSLIKIVGELKGDQIEATFTQNGQTFPLKLTSYKEQPITYEVLTIPVKGGELKVALQMPEQPTGEIAIIHAGSGPTNKDGNTLGGGSNNSLKMLAEDLAGEGIASIRFDKRGIGENKALIAKEEELTLEAYVEDVQAIIAYIQQEERFNGLHLIGHSEGALIMTLVAKEAQVDSLTLVAGVGRAAGVLLNEQLATSLPPNLLSEAKMVIEKLTAGQRVTTVSAELQTLFRPSVQPYLISWLKYAPQEELRKVTAPVLIIQGENDIQVTKEDAEALKAASPEATLHYIDKMNHVLKEVSINRDENIASYSNPNLPLANGLVKEISTFIK